MNKKVFQGAAYTTPICEELTVVPEGTVLSTSGSLGDLDDNNIYTEEF